MQPLRPGGKIALRGALLTALLAFPLLHGHLRYILSSVLEGFVAGQFTPPPIAALLEIPEEDRGASATASFVQGFERAADYVADAIVKGGVAAVDETIDRILDDSHYDGLYQQLVASVPWSAASRAQQSPADASQLEVPTLVRDRVVLALRLEFEVFRAQWRLMALSGIDGGESVRPPSAEALFNVSVPHQMRAAAIAYRIGEVCAMALSSGKLASSNELAVVLVEKWIHGTRTSLGVWAAILRGADSRAPEIDAQILPRSYLIDLERVHDEYREAQHGLAIALDEVDRTGLGFPVQES